MICAFKAALCQDSENVSTLEVTETDGIFVTGTAMKRCNYNAERLDNNGAGSTVDALLM